jgi:tRNA(His) 5'-end guanylyltransferase
LVHPRPTGTADHTSDLWWISSPEKMRRRRRVALFATSFVEFGKKEIGEFLEMRHCQCWMWCILSTTRLVWELTRTRMTPETGCRSFALVFIFWALGHLDLEAPL